MLRESHRAYFWSLPENEIILHDFSSTTNKQRITLTSCFLRHVTWIVQDWTYRFKFKFSFFWSTANNVKLASYLNTHTRANMIINLKILEDTHYYFYFLLWPSGSKQYLSSRTRFHIFFSFKRRNFIRRFVCLI